MRGPKLVGMVLVAVLVVWLFFNSTKLVYGLEFLFFGKPLPGTTVSQHGQTVLEQHLDMQREGETSVRGGPSLSASFVDRVLEQAGSPARGTGQALEQLSRRYGVDDAYALATFRKESSYGRVGVAVETHGLGNIICAGYRSCSGRFRSYSTWQEGYEDFYRLIAMEYVGHGLTTVEAIVPRYAPASDGNNPTGYIRDVRSWMTQFRTEGGRL